MAFEKETRKSRGPAKGGSRGGAGGGKKPFGDSSKSRAPRSDFGDKPSRGAFGDKPRSRSASSDRPPRREGSSEDRPKRSYSRDGAPPRKDFGDKPRAPRGDSSFSSRDSARGDRPKRDFGDRPPRREGGSEDRPRRAYSEDRPKRDFGDKPRAPRGDFGDRPKRDFGDRPPRREGSEDRPKRSYSRDGAPPRKDFGDRPPRREGSEDRPRRSYSEDRPKRDFGDKPRAPRGDFGDRPKRDFGDRPPRRESSSEDRPRRDYSRAGDAPRAPRREYSSDRPPRKEYAPRRDDDFAPGKREGFEKRPAKEKAEPIKGHELLFYGVHAVHAALRNPARKVAQIWVTESGEERLKEAWDKKRHPEPEILERRDLDTRLTAGAVHQGMAIAVEPLPDVFLSDIMTAAQAPHAERHVLVILDEVTDPHNVGAVLRSMSAFGAKAMIVHKRNAPGITGVMAKIATGAVENIPMVAVTNISQAMTELKNSGFYMLGLDENADYPIQNAPKEGHIALVLGAEGEGLRALTRSTCDAIASIETFGDIKSLNVSNAAAIGLYALTQKQ